MQTQEPRDAESRPASGVEQSDLELVKRAQRGERGAFDLLVLRYQHKVVKLVARLLRDPTEAEDVAQEAFVKAYRRLPRSAATVRSTPGCTGSQSIRHETRWRPGSADRSTTKRT